MAKTTRKSRKGQATGWTVERTDKAAYQIQWETQPTKQWPYYILIISDVHWDNADCKLDILTRHLNQAVERNAPIVIVGDFFCCMQGKYDPRADKASLRPEHRRTDYLDGLVETARDFFLPYKDHIALVTVGNHELSILSRHEVDLIERFVAAMRLSGAVTIKGEYTGFLKLDFMVQRRSRPASAGIDYKIHYTHGHGGGGPVTKGVIDFNRVAAEIDADAYVMGHIHQLNHVISTRTRMTSQGKVETRRIQFLRSSTYKDEFAGGKTNWHASKGQFARPLGGWWGILSPMRTDTDARRMDVKFMVTDE